MRVLYTISLLFLLFSCNHKDDASEPNEYAAKFIKELNTSDTFLFEFPFFYSHRTEKIDSINYFQRQRFNRMLSLQDIQNGVDSIHIRMVYEIVLIPEFLMLELTNREKKWMAEVSLIKSHFNIKEEKVDSFSRIVRTDFPKSGWIKLINKLFELKILTLEDERVISRDKYVAIADGDGIDFEIATSNVFRAYGYSNPEYQLKDNLQIRNIIEIKKLLFSEFGLLNKWYKQIIDDFERGTEEDGNEEKIKNHNSENRSKGNIKINEMTIQDVGDTTTINTKGKRE